MNEFFKPRRRKIGMVTLLLACVFVAGWVRSKRVNDTIWATIGTQPQIASIGLLSVDQQLGVFVIRSVKRVTIVQRFGWTKDSIAHGTRTLDAEFGWKGRETEFQFTTSNGGNTQAVFVPYWSITIFLSLLASWLLLSKPRTPASRCGLVDDHDSR